MCIILAYQYMHVCALYANDIILHWTSFPTFVAGKKGIISIKYGLLD
jgi:hypothetical protein